MGWTCSDDWRKKEDVVSHCVSQYMWGKNWEILKHSVRGNNLWVLSKLSDGEKKGCVFITLFLLSKEAGVYCYKDITDSMRPYEVNVPVSYVNAVEASGRDIEPAFQAWLDSVRAYHVKEKEKRTKRSKLEEGMVVNLYGSPYELLSHYGRKGWKVACKKSGAIMRMTAKQAAKSEVVV